MSMFWQDAERNTIKTLWKHYQKYYAQDYGGSRADFFEWVGRWLDSLFPEEIPVKPGREVVETKRAGDGWTYRLEKVKCGKENCRCARGELHGPYWYAYRTVDGKTKSKYIGKKLPEQVRKELHGQAADMIMRRIGAPELPGLDGQQILNP
jgi:hypothetical protein